MSTIKSIKIIEEKNEIDDHLLDIIGNEFKFDHAKGLAEWLKNSVDAYIRSRLPDKKQYVILRFQDKDNNDYSFFECIDFVGMTENDITKAFKRWGDPRAAKRGSKAKTYGGHGNGGKFYMRQQFKKSYFITYRNGFLNIFGFNKKKKYGFAKGFKNKKVSPEKAIELARIKNIKIPSEIKKQLINEKTGFTVVRGFSPFGMKNKIKLKKIINKFKNHPQARRIIERINLSIIYNNEYLCDLLVPDKLSPLQNFEEPKIINIPDNYQDGDSIIRFSNSRFPKGKLILKTSEDALGRGGRLGELNRIDFIGELGVIASYKIFELGVNNFPQAAFIYGDCECPILEDPEKNCVKNDREKLHSNDLTDSLLRWVSEQIDIFASEIREQEEKKKKMQTRKISSEFNEVLNEWKNKFMKKVFSDIFSNHSEIKGNINFGFEERKNIRKKLVYPEEGLEFSFGLAKIPVDKSFPITLKTATPEIIPVGAVVSIASSNNFIELEENKITVKNDNLKLTDDGRKVAVCNLYVRGRKPGEKGEIIAKAGEYLSKIKIEVVKEKENSQKKKEPRYPIILLSSNDIDPLSEKEDTVTLSSRDPLVFQRPQDVPERIYWINTSSPLAEAILKELEGAESPRWKDFIFQRYVDIFIKEALYELQKKDPENFRPEVIDNQIIDELTRKIHASAVSDLENVLFRKK
jgi:hypothetical protein